jgi:NDP-sugar pyrophosphorylase family protein
MSNTGQFELSPDARGRIVGFTHSASTELLLPESIGEHLDGGEQVTYHGIEYDLDERGNLIHPAVEIPEYVVLGHGVLLGAGVKFEDLHRYDNPNRTAIDDRVLIRGGKQWIGSGVHFKHHAIFRGSSVGPDAEVGSYARIGEESRLGVGVIIGDNVKIYRQVVVAEGANVGYNAKIGDDVYVDPGVNIGHAAKLEPIGTGKGGISILVSQDVESHATVIHNVAST